MRNRLFVLIALTLGVMMTGVAANKKFTLVIDAGHGGNDAGAIGAITKEKNINLNVALAFGRLVERNCPDVKVIYTRKTDVFVPLHTRADIANRNKADLFVSIHTNALPKGRISRGLETYTLGMHRAADNLDVAKRENSVILIESDYKPRYQGFDPNSSESYIMFEFMQDHNMAQSVEMAKFVQRRTCAAAGRQNKGVKQAGFLVLRETSMPSCLIELGFISTSDEERYLHSSNGVQQLATGIYQAFLDYKEKYDTNITVPYKAQAKTEQVNIPSVVPQDVQDEVKEEKEKRRKSKAAQALADAREGKLDDMPTGNEAPKADSIIAMAPVVKETPAPEVKETPVPVVKETPAPVQQTVAPTATPAATLMQTVAEQEVKYVPVFKVQVLASGTKLKATDPRLKGVQNIDFYQEGGLFKYTVGASVDYDEIYQLRKTVAARFPQAFIIAFKNGERTNVQTAIQEYKANKNKR